MRTYIYADESGNFDFSSQPQATRYFMLVSVALEENAIAPLENDLRHLQRELAWESLSLPNGFHATNDKQYVRNRVFAVLSRHDFRIDATLIEKRKVNPSLRNTAERFYGFAWYAHLRGLATTIGISYDETLITAASITRKMTAAFCAEVRIAERRLPPSAVMKCAISDASSNPMLQVADYCAWALRRKWEREPPDTRSYAWINSKIATEYARFGSSSTLYY